MALVVEDGSGVAGANSFNTAAEIVAYADMRGVIMTEAEAVRGAIEAMDFIGTQCFGGQPQYELPFPRIGLTLASGAMLEPGTIPIGVKRAHAQLALDVKRGVKLNVSASAEPMLKREKTGPIETEFFAPGDAPNSTAPQLPIAMAALAPFFCGVEPFRLKTYRA